MTEVYEICVEFGYLGMGCYGESVSEIRCRQIRLPSDYSKLGQTVFFFQEDAEANIPEVQRIVDERNAERWRDNPTPFGLHGLGGVPHSHGLR